ncbi:hypothetical protein AB0I28_12730 [Phytomonospora sp. NPDC050363]|uniref:hypothetical protein n=1 Tax=Phytomonospora sp. NPDC050363 TaxID=3155642 RepID=UPI0033D96364
MKVDLYTNDRYPHVELTKATTDPDAMEIPDALFDAWQEATAALEAVEKTLTLAAIKAGELGKGDALVEKYYVCPHGRSVYGHCHQHKHLPVAGEAS